MATKEEILKAIETGGKTKQEKPEAPLSKKITGGIVSFGKNLFETTIGEKGIMGVGKMPGRVAEAVILGNDQRELQESRNQLQGITDQLFERIKKETDEAKKERYRKIIRDNLSQISAIGSQWSDLDKNILTPEEAMATTIRAGTTVASLAMGAPTGYLSAGGKSGITAALYTAAEGIEKKLPSAQIAKTTIIGGTIGVLTGMAFYGVEQGSKAMARGIYKKLAQWAGAKGPRAEKVAGVMIDRKMVSTASQMKKQIDVDIRAGSKIIDKTLQGFPKRQITQNQIISGAINEGEKMERSALQRFFDPEGFQNALEKGLDKIGVKIGLKRLNLFEANELRKKVDNKLGDKAFQTFFEELPEVKTGLMALRKSLEDMVKSGAPATENYFNQIAPLVETSKVLENIAIRSGKLMPITTTEITALVGAGGFYQQALPYVAGIMAMRRGVVSGIVPTVLARGEILASDIARLANTAGGRILIWSILSKQFAK